MLKYKQAYLAANEKNFTPLNHNSVKCLRREMKAYSAGAKPILQVKAHLTGAINPVNPACPMESILSIPSGSKHKS